MRCLPRRGQQWTDRFYIIVLPFIVKGKSKMQKAKCKKQNVWDMCHLRQWWYFPYDIFCTSTPRSPSMAWRGMITSASSPLRELVYFALKQLIHSKERILDSCLCGIISCGPPPHNSPRTSRPCRVVRRVPSGVVRPHFGRIWGLNSSQPPPPFGRTQRMLPRPAESPFPRSPATKAASPLG